MAKYRHWLEQPDVIVLCTYVTLLQLQSTCQHLLVTVLHYGFTLQVCANLYGLPIHTCLRWRYSTVLHYMSVPTLRCHQMCKTELPKMLKVSMPFSIIIF